MIPQQHTEVEVLTPANDAGGTWHPAAAAPAARAASPQGTKVVTSRWR